MKNAACFKFRAQTCSSYEITGFTQMFNFQEIQRIVTNEMNACVNVYWFFSTFIASPGGGGGYDRQDLYVFSFA